MIFWLYFRGWLIIDVVSVLPFQELSDLGDSPTKGAGDAKLMIIRLVRLLRLLKLFRVLRASRIYKRWESRIELAYAAQALLKFVLLILFACHWMACLWGLLPSLEGDGAYTWVMKAGIEDLDAYTLYTVSFYFSVYTITSIGFGDITAANADEYLVCSIMMMAGAFLFAYFLGNACSLISQMNPHAVAYQQTMDELNFFMRDHNLPKEQRMKLREYLTESRPLQHLQSYKQIMGLLTPTMQGAVAYASNKEWLTNVPYFVYKDGMDSMEHEGFIVQVAMRMVPRVYAPRELIRGDILHIVHKGLAVKEGRVVTKGGVWGADMILANPLYTSPSPARALTYVVLTELAPDDLKEVLKNFPSVQLHIRWATLQLALTRAIILDAKQRRAIATPYASGTLVDDNTGPNLMDVVNAKTMRLNFQFEDSEGQKMNDIQKSVQHIEEQQELIVTQLNTTMKEVASQKGQMAQMTAAFQKLTDSLVLTLPDKLVHDCNDVSEVYPFEGNKSRIQSIVELPETAEDVCASP